MADLVLKVTPEEVREKASQIAGQKALMEGIMGDLQTKINQLETYFKSTAGETYVQQYTNVSRNIKNSLDALLKHTTNLAEAANKYDTDEGNQKTKASSLSADNIF